MRIENVLGRKAKGVYRVVISLTKDLIKTSTKLLDVIFSRYLSTSVLLFRRKTSTLTRSVEFKLKYFRLHLCRSSPVEFLRLIKTKPCKNKVYIHKTSLNDKNH